MIEYLLQAARDRLRTVVPLADKLCDLQPGGRPPARMGEYYISLDEARIQAGEKTHLREVYTINVWITKRTGKYPRDKWSEIYLQNATGLGALERKIIAAIHGRQEVRVAANTLGGLPTAGTGDIFQQPLWYTGRGATAPANAEWTGGDPENDAFLVRTLPFTGGLRVQALDIMH